MPNTTCSGEAGYDCIDGVLAKGLCGRCYQRQWARLNSKVRAERYQRWYEANREHKAKYDRRYHASNRQKELERSRRWREAHPEKGREYDRNRRARKASASHIRFTAEQLAQRMAFWGNRCWMCGGAFEEVDHVIALARGGPHVLANLRPSCKSCNSAKGAKRVA